MAAPLITLGSGQVLVTQSTSTLGISIDSTTAYFGMVQKVSELEDNYAVGNTVFFDTTGAITFNYSSASYFLITTDKIFFKEP